MGKSEAILKRHFQEQIVPNNQFGKQFSDSIRNFDKGYPTYRTDVIILIKLVPYNERSIPYTYEPLVKALAKYLDIKFYPSEALVYETCITLNSVAIIGEGRDCRLFEFIYNHIAKSLDRIYVKTLPELKRNRTNQRRQKQRGKHITQRIDSHKIASAYKFKTVKTICALLNELLEKRKRTPYYHQGHIITKLQLVNRTYETTRPYTF